MRTSADERPLPPSGDVALVEHEDPPGLAAREVEGDRGAHHAGAEDDDVRGPVEAAAQSNRRRRSFRTRRAALCPGAPVTPAARVRAGAAEVEALDRRAVLRVARDRPHEEELLEVQVAVEDVALGQAVGALEVERRQDLPRDDGAGHVGRVFADLPDDPVAEQLPVLVPGPLLQAVGDVLDEAGHDVPAFRREARVHVRGDDAVDPELLRDLARAWRCRSSARRTRARARA